MKFKDHMVTLEGREQTVGQWAAERKVPISTVQSRRARGATWADALVPSAVGKTLRRPNLRREVKSTFS